MLFDLRSRGRRRTVQGVYLALAIILGGGLVLFGVGTGSGVGGLLDAFTNSGSGSNKPAISQAEKSAVRQTQLQPNNPAAWADDARGFLFGHRHHEEHRGHAMDSGIPVRTGIL